MDRNETRTLVRSPGTGTLLAAAGWAVVAAVTGREAGLGPACLVGLAALGMCAWRRRAGPWVWAFPAAFSAAVPTVGCVWAPPGPARIEGEVLAGVRSDPVRGDCSFRIRHLRQEFLCVIANAPASFRVLPGDRVRGFGRVPLQPERRQRNAMPRVVTTHDALAVQPGPLGLARLAAQCRLAMQDTLLRLVRGEPGLLLCHLVLGTGPQLEPGLVSAHRDTGLSHLLAVSGAHLTMLGWLLGFGFASATGRSPLGNRGFRRFCGVTLFFYAVITGMEPPIFRAMVAAFVLLISYGKGRPVPLAAMLSLPALFTAVIAPEDLFGVSFNLSYAAVIGLALSGGLRGKSFTDRWIIGPIKCSTWATLCTTPLTLWYFGRFAPWTIVATPILSPIIAGMLGLALMATCVAPLLPWLAAAIAWPLAGLSIVYCAAIRCTAELPFTPIFASTRPEWIVVAVSLWLGVSCIVVLRSRRGVLALCAALSVPHFLPPRVPPQVGLSLLAVGHGHAGLLRLRDGTHVLVDCGSLGNPRRAARSVADSLLPRRRLEFLILTHGDFDHVGGVLPLVDRVRIECALLPVEMRNTDTADALRAQGCTVILLEPGARRALHCDVLVHRPSTTAENRNDDSAWVHVEFGNFRAVLTGDALEAATGDWLSSDLASPADVLVLPHHGRPHGAITRLLSKVRPRVALVSSSGSDGFSAQGVLARRAGCDVLHTGLDGNVHVLATEPPTVLAERPRRLFSGSHRKD
jgi:competence protein ComEC